MSLVSVGNAIVDLALTVPSLPERGGDVLAGGSGAHAGGSVNTLVAAVRQGLPAVYAGAIGDGPFAALVRSELAAAGIEVVGTPVAGLDTGITIVLTDAGGERTFVTRFGAEAMLSAAQLAGVYPGPDDLVHVSGYGLLPSTNVRALSPWLDALDPAVAVLLDPGPLVVDIEPGVWRRASARADWLTCSLREAQLITGRADAVAAAGWLAANGGGVVVRLGAAGSVLAHGGEVVEVPAFAVQAVDTNGAGDAHAGAFLAALARGESPVDAVRVANACAALSTTRVGPATAPTLAETLALLGREPRV